MDPRSGEKVDFTVVLAGKSGSGKSTLLQNLLGEKISDDVTTYPTTEKAVTRFTMRDGMRMHIVVTHPQNICENLTSSLSASL